MDNEIKEIEDTHCHCGVLYGEHKSNIKNNMKYFCVACGKLIGRCVNNRITGNQYPERYIEKGNYCDKCNFKASQCKKSCSNFADLFKS